MEKDSADRELTESHEWGDQNEDGVDRDAIRFNLALSLDERVERHLRPLETAIALADAAKAAGYRIIC